MLINGIKICVIVHMKRKYKDLQELKSGFSTNKKFPAEYQEEILVALSHFPELKEARIRFVVVDSHDHPFHTTVSHAGLFSPKARRHYTVHIARAAKLAPDEALMQQLPFEARVAAMAHELAHIVQLEKKGGVKGLTFMKHEADRTMEREADICVIEHGLGFELYTHASYLRTIPGLIDTYRHADINRLHPNEILEALPPDQLQEVHRF